MGDSFSNFNFKAMADSLSENIRKFSGFSPDQVRQAGRISDDDLRTHIFMALKDGAKTGHEIGAAIEETIGSSAKVSPSQIYPLLESLVDSGEITFALKKDRKTYTLTETGKAAAKAAGKTKQEEKVADNSSNLPKWVDLRGEVPRAGARLANLLVEVTRYGTKEQQQQAAEAVDETRRRIHEILSAK